MWAIRGRGAPAMHSAAPLQFRMDVLRGMLPGKAAGGNPPADWDTLQTSCAVFFALWALNQILFRALGFNSGKAGDLCVPARAKRAVGDTPPAQAGAAAIRAAC